MLVFGNKDSTVFFNGRNTTGILNGAVVWGNSAPPPEPTFTGTATLNLGFTGGNYKWNVSVNKRLTANTGLYSNFTGSGTMISAVTASSRATAHVTITGSSHFAAVPAAPAGLASASCVSWGRSGNYFTAKYSGVVSDDGWTMDSGITTGRKCVRILSTPKLTTAYVSANSAPIYRTGGGIGIFTLPSASATSCISAKGKPYIFVNSGSGVSYFSASQSFAYKACGIGAGPDNYPPSNIVRLYFNSARNIDVSGKFFLKNSGSTRPSASMGLCYSMHSNTVYTASGFPNNQSFSGNAGAYSTTLDGRWQNAGLWYNAIPVISASVGLSSMSGQWSASANVV